MIPALAAELVARRPLLSVDGGDPVAVASMMDRGLLPSGRSVAPVIRPTISRWIYETASSPIPTLYDSEAASRPKAVRVSVAVPGKFAAGSGRMTRNGRGRWSGHSDNARCSGSWTAQRY